jgi:predicted ribosomally synthesized peptide with SipW-like signal peptide
MKKLMPLAASIALILMASLFASVGTLAVLSDTETSNGNTFTAASLDLNVDGGDINVVKFTVGNMVPGNQPKAMFTLTNVGTITGYLDLENIVVKDYENLRIEPEISAGDTTDGVGELSSVVGCYLFIDYGGDGWFSTGDIVIYNAMTNALPGNFELDEPINAGSTTYITAIFNWWSTPNDNQAMTDSFTLDIAFELAQTAGQ